MREGASVTDHVNEFNSLLSILVSMDIKFDDEVQAVLLLSSLPNNWSGIVTIVASTSRTTKLTFEGIRDLILGEDVRRRNTTKSVGFLLRTYGRGSRHERGQGSRCDRSKSKKRGQSTPHKDITCWNCQHNGHFKN
uniref:Retrovirus-related Pol polyprotein from transposon TNT 1-94 n=1 Tax=Cajanus cajan TaxID=3821 RepID=A0A151QUT7_CAJCA|nr:Retrovirus-related Pol polyprotein from transposon TNT 1-94 [Cajanus cajan]